MAEGKPRRLWVCWKEPGAAPDSSDAILTFLLPSAEQRMKVAHRGEVLFGREASLMVRKEARSAYFEVVARLAVLMASNGRTNWWWYHRVSFKDCEADPTFDRLIALFTILQVARERGIHNLVLVGGQPEFRRVLQESFQISVSG